MQPGVCGAVGVTARWFTAPETTLEQGHAILQGLEVLELVPKKEIIMKQKMDATHNHVHVRNIENAFSVNS